MEALGGQNLVIPFLSLLQVILCPVFMTSMVEGEKKKVWPG